MAFGRAYQFKALCFDLSTAPRSSPGSWHHNQLGQVSPLAVPVSDASQHGPQEPDFEGFSGSGAGFSPSITNRRIFVLQQAISSFVEAPARLSLLPLPSCSWGLSQDEVPPTSSADLMEFSGRARLGRMDSLCLTGSLVVVRRAQPACRRVSGAPDFGPSLLVRRLRPGMGCSSGGPVCLGSLVQSRAPVINQPAGTSGHLSWPLPFSVSSSGSDDRSLIRQHQGSGVSPAPRGNIFACAQ